MKDKVVFVTGGGSGIGEACAIVAAEQGAKVVIVGGRTVERLQNVVNKLRKIGAEALAIQLDVGNPESIENAFGIIMEKYGRIDSLVNSAGICPLTPFDQATVEEWRTVLDINVIGSFLCCQKAMKIMTEQNIKGSIVNIGSLGGKVGGVATSPAYSCSKASVWCLTMAAAKFSGQHGIRVNCVAPGYIESDMTHSFPEDVQKKITSIIPLPYTGQPRDVGEMVVFLLSSKAHFITGETVDVNGGAFTD